MKGGLRVLALLLGITAPAPAGDPQQVTDLGIPVTAPNRISYKTAHAFGPAKIDLLCWTTTAESGGTFCALNLSDGSFTFHPLNTLEAYPIVFGSDGRVYTGSTSGEVFFWHPLTGEWGVLGVPLFRYPGSSLNHVRVLCEGDDGWLYAGSCHGERARVNMVDGSVESLPAIAESGKWYISAVAKLPDGRIAFGCGYQARVFIYDPRLTRDVAQILPSDWTNDGFCFNLLAGKSVLYATHFPSGRRGAFDAATGGYLGEIPWPRDSIHQPWSHWAHSSGYGSSVDFYLIPGTDAVVTSDGSHVYRHDPRSSPTDVRMPVREFSAPAALALDLRYEVTSDCRVHVYDAVRSVVKEEHTLLQPAVERSLFGLGTGPDGRIYGGAYQSTLLFRHDPASLRTEVLGDHHPGWSGETYSFAVSGGELICASYTNGAIVAYDPASPWDCSRGRMTNPRLIGFLGQNVYRPYAMRATPDGRVWAVGPAGWGSTGGGIGCIDPRTRQITTVPLPFEPLEVVPLAAGRLLVAGESRLVWWDAHANKALASGPAPFRVTGAASFPGGISDSILLLGDSVLVVVSCERPGVVSTEASWRIPSQAQRVLVFDETVVVAGRRGISSLDLLTGSVRVLSTIPCEQRWAITVADDWVYYARGPHLLRSPLLKP